MQAVQGIFLSVSSIVLFGLLHYLPKCDMLDSNGEFKSMNLISKLFSAARQHIYL